MATNLSYRARLRKLLMQSFSDEDLEGLCFDMGIDWDSIAGDNKIEKVVELIEFCVQNNRLVELIDLCRMQRPATELKQEWQDLLLVAQNQPEQYGTSSIPQQSITTTEAPAPAASPVAAPPTLQACFQCNGLGKVHLSNSSHTPAANSKVCFFCDDCPGCKGTGVIPGNVSRCPRCGGKGFIHTSSHDHTTPADRKCFFCDTCATCKGKGWLK